jgi:hypothetical protein
MVCFVTVLNVHVGTMISDHSGAVNYRKQREGVESGFLFVSVSISVLTITLGCWYGTLYLFTCELYDPCVTIQCIPSFAPANNPLRRTLAYVIIVFILVACALQRRPTLSIFIPPARIQGPWRRQCLNIRLDASSSISCIQLYHAWLKFLLFLIRRHSLSTPKISRGFNYCSSRRRILVGFDTLLFAFWLQVKSSLHVNDSNYYG